jgi:predicted DNA-binding transcriptional regulator AlpA
MLDKDNFSGIGEAPEITGLSQSSIRRKLADPASNFPRSVGNLSTRLNPFPRRQLLRWAPSRMRGPPSR